MTEVAERKAHFIYMSLEEKLSYRDCKIVNGYFLFILCLLPDMPTHTLSGLSLFAVTSGKPVFIGNIYQEMWDDDGYLMHIINKTFPC